MPDLKLGTLARCYGLTRQAVHQYSRRHKLTNADWSAVELLFIKMLESGSDSPFRRKLSDPSVRKAIQETIYLAENHAHSKHCVRLSKKWNHANEQAGKIRIAQ